MRKSHGNTNRGLPPSSRAPEVTAFDPSAPPLPTQAPSTPPPASAEAAPIPLENAEEYTSTERLELSRRAALALARGADVPGRVQKGPTCGLYALGMVMDYWEKRDGSSTTALVQDSDLVRDRSHSMTPDTHKRLLDVARERGFTTQGEMFYAIQLATLAEEFGYSADIHEHFTVDVLVAVLDRKRPVLVAFDVDDDGNPGEFEGLNAHWAVIEAHFEKDGERYLVASHGWSGGEYVWPAGDLMRSMAQVKHIDDSAFPNAPADLMTTLGGRIIEIYR